VYVREDAVFHARNYTYRAVPLTGELNIMG